MQQHGGHYKAVVHIRLFILPYNKLFYIFFVNFGNQNCQEQKSRPKL